MSESQYTHTHGSLTVWRKSGALSRKCHEGQKQTCTTVYSHMFFRQSFVGDLLSSSSLQHKRYIPTPDTPIYEGECPLGAGCAAYLTRVSRQMKEELLLRLRLVIVQYSGGENVLTVSTSASRFPGMMNFCTLVAPSLEISPSGIDPLRRLFDRLRILRDFIFPTPIGIRPVILTRFVGFGEMYVCRSQSTAATPDAPPRWRWLALKAIAVRV